MPFIIILYVSFKTHNLLITALDSEIFSGIDALTEVKSMVL